MSQIELLEPKKDESKIELLPDKANFIEHPQAGKELLDKPTFAIPQGPAKRNKMSSVEYDTYMKSITPENKKQEEDFDLHDNPEKHILNKIEGNPTINFIKGVGDTVGMNQAYGLARISTPFNDANVNKIIGEGIEDMNRVVRENTLKKGDAYGYGALLGRNATQAAAIAYSGANLVPLLMFETAAAAVDIAAQPGVNTGDKPVGAVEGGTQVGINAGITATALALTKIMPYVLGGFKAQNLREALDPSTKLGIQNYNQMADAIEFATENNLRLSDLMIRGSVDEGAMSMVENANFFKLRDIFKGSDEFAKQSLDMLQDITTLGQKQASALKGKTIPERRAMGIKFQNEVKVLREQYRKSEGVIWDGVKEAMPDHKVELIDFHKDLSQHLIDNGIPPPSVNAIDRIVTKRFGAGKKALVKERDTLLDARSELQLREKAYNLSIQGKVGNNDEIVAQLRTFKDERKALNDRILEINNSVKLSATDIMNNIKLINKKINIPGGNISLADAQEIRGLRLGKEMLETKLDDLLADGYPDALEKWHEAKRLTMQRVKSFGNNLHDDDLILTNALLNKDTQKVLTMLKDPERGLQHLEFVRDNLGAESEGFKAASSLFLQAKMGLSDGVLALKRTDKLVGGIRGNFDKIQQSLASITPSDIKFIKENFGDKFGRDLSGYMSNIDMYSELYKQAEKASSVRGQTSVWRYAGKNIQETPGLLADFISYSTIKAGHIILGSLPRVRAATGGGYMAVTSEEEWGSEEHFKDILQGVGVGYAVGIAGRHLFEEQIKQVQRVVMRRKGLKPVMEALAKFKVNARTLAKGISSGKIMTKTVYDKAIKPGVDKVVDYGIKKMPDNMKINPIQNKHLNKGE